MTILGIVGMIYAAILFVNSPDDNMNIKSLVTYGILGLVFFMSGVGLVRTTKDE